jgi:hypothetical protein
MTVEILGEQHARFAKLVADSALPEIDKKNLVRALDIVPDAVLTEVVTLCTEDPSWVIKFNNNFKAKLDATTRGDIRAWARILRDEEVFLAKI